MSELRGNPENPMERCITCARSELIRNVCHCENDGECHDPDEWCGQWQMMTA